MKAEKNKGTGRAKGKNGLWNFWQKKIYFICKWAFVKAAKCFHELYSSPCIWRRDILDSVDPGSNLVFKDEKTFDLWSPEGWPDGQDTAARLPRGLFLKTKYRGFLKLHRVLWHRKMIFKTSLRRTSSYPCRGRSQLPWPSALPSWPCSLTIEKLCFYFFLFWLFLTIKPTASFRELEYSILTLLSK